MCLVLYPQLGSDGAGGINPVEQCWEEKCHPCLQRSFSPPLEIRTWLAVGRIPDLAVSDCRDLQEWL